MPGQPAKAERTAPRAARRAWERYVEERYMEKRPAHTPSAPGAGSRAAALSGKQEQL